LLPGPQPASNDILPKSEAIMRKSWSDTVYAGEKLKRTCPLRANKKKAGQFGLVKFNFFG
jgi:hypothetical protein